MCWSVLLLGSVWVTCPSEYLPQLSSRGRLHSTRPSCRAADMQGMHLWAVSKAAAQNESACSPCLRGLSSKLTCRERLRPVQGSQGLVWNAFRVIWAKEIICMICPGSWAIHLWSGVSQLKAFLSNQQTLWAHSMAPVQTRDCPQERVHCFLVCGKTVTRFVKKPLLPASLAIRFSTSS